MKDLKRIGQGVLWIGAGFLWASPLFGQRQDSEKPKPAAHDYSLLLDSPVNGQVIDQAAPTTQPDNRPLSGIQNPTVGTAEMRHSYWVPGITYSNGLRSNGSNAATNTGWQTTSFISTDVSLLQGWSHSTLSANYSGGGYFSTDKNLPDRSEKMANAFHGSVLLFAGKQLRLWRSKRTSDARNCRRPGGTCD